MRKHTKGPWYHGTRKGYCANMVFAEGDDAVCEVFGLPLHQHIEDVVGQDRWEEGVANARLIAAAPDLLEALKELLSACEDDCGAVGDLTEFDGDDEPVGGGLNDDGSPDPMALTFGHLRRAARAIAKAEGGAA